MPYLFAPDGGVSRKIKTLYAPAAGINCKQKSLWAPDHGINRKIFSSAFCSVAYAGEPTGKYTVTFTAGSDGSGVLNIANNSGSSVTGGYFYIDFTFPQAISVAAYAEILKLVNATHSITNGSAPSGGNVLYATWSQSYGAFTPEQSIGDGNNLTANGTTPVITRTLTNAPILDLLKIRLIFYLVSQQIWNTGHVVISWPAGGLYLVGQQVNGFLQ